MAQDLLGGKTFAELAATDVTKHIEKKGRFSYLSWPFAVAELRKKAPGARWQAVTNDNGDPLFKAGTGGMVCVRLLAGDDVFEEWFPVLDYQNRSIPHEKITAFDVNTALKRGLVKAIACVTGIGLHIYAGEDLPPNEAGEPQKLDPLKAEPAIEPPQPNVKEITKIRNIIQGNFITAPQVRAYLNGAKEEWEGETIKDGYKTCYEFEMRFVRDPAAISGIMAFYAPHAKDGKWSRTFNKCIRETRDRLDIDDDRYKKIVDAAKELKEVA